MSELAKEITFVLIRITNLDLDLGTPYSMCMVRCTLSKVSPELQRLGQERTSHRGPLGRTHCKPHGLQRQEGGEDMEDPQPRHR
jgi:hypothetical protein